MQTFYALLQLLVVVQMVVEDVIDFVHELLLFSLLLLDSRESGRHLFLHAFALQPHIFDDETQVFVDDFEMLRFVVHLGLLLLKSLNDLHFRSNS